MTARQRADRLLVERGLFESRARAQAAIAAGRVSADGIALHKPSEQIPANAVIKAEPAHPYVSRGGVKLAAALDRFGLDVTDRVCLDVGASTGGFTEVLLGRGARRIYAVDVGRAQLHPRLRGHERVVSIEGTDIRTLDAGQFAGHTDLATPDLATPDLATPDLATPDLATVDVSFISLKLVLPAIGKLLAGRAQLLALVKPQFEAGRREIKKGIVRDAKIHDAVCDDIAAFLVGEGWRVGGRMASPIPGGDGNQEFFIEAERG